MKEKVFDLSEILIVAWGNDELFFVAVSFFSVILIYSSVCIACHSDLVIDGDGGTFYHHDNAFSTQQDCDVYALEILNGIVLYRIEMKCYQLSSLSY